MQRKKFGGVKRGRTVARNVAANKIPSGGKTSLLRVKLCGQKIESPSNPVIINEIEVPRPDLYRNRHPRRRRPLVAIDQEQGQIDAANPARTSDRQITR